MRPVPREAQLASREAAAWGQEVLGPDPVGFGGQWGYQGSDAGGYLLGHRFYNASTGRFLTRDPIGYQGGVNLYGFVGNNPVTRRDPSGLDPDEALDAISNNRSSIFAAARKNGIQPELIAGIVFAEVNAGGVSHWNSASRQLSIQKFATLGKGDLGITKFHQFSKDHPEQKTYFQRVIWAEHRDANDSLSVTEAAGMLGALARRRYPSHFGSLSPAEMSIVATEYNEGPKPVRPNAQPNKEGRALLLGFHAGIAGKDNVIGTGLYGSPSQVEGMSFDLSQGAEP